MQNLIACGRATRWASIALKRMLRGLLDLNIGTRLTADSIDVQD